MNKPKNDLITVVITTRNEEKYIKNCIDSIILFDTSAKFTFEILIVDGMSTDATLNIIRKMNLNNVRIIKNPQITQAHGFNLGIQNSLGNWVAWLGAHSVYPSNYLIGLFNSARKSNSDYTGGIIETIPYDHSYSASIVQALTTHEFGVGNSGFRTGTKEGLADTASYGLFKRDVFDKIGYLDERLIRAQDFEFNARIRRSGGKVWLNPSLIVKYLNQPNLLLFLKKQLFKEAPYNAYMWYLAPYTFSYRHAITGVFATGIIGGGILSFLFNPVKYMYSGVLGLYALLALFSAFQQAKRYKKILHVLTLPPSFFAYHFVHGIGVLLGLTKLLLNLSPVQRIKEPWTGFGKYRYRINKD